MRLAGLLATTVVFATQPASADIVRHLTIPNSFWGTWASSSDACQKQSGSAVVLSSKRYATSDSKCHVDWVDETAAAQGPIYSAHLRCTGLHKPARKTISNVVFAQRDARKISIGSNLYDLKTYERCK